MRPLTLKEAAQFLRMSNSSLYQRKDIPRFRRPGSRTLLFDQDELEAWLRTGRLGSASVAELTVSYSQSTSNSNTGPYGAPKISASDSLDIRYTGVYHRNPLYR